MAITHPYATSQRGLRETISHLRTSFPPTVTPDTLKALGFAPNNEGTVIKVLKFLNVIDKDGRKNSSAANVFLLSDTEFQKEFGALVEGTYVALFELHSENAWQLPQDQLIVFFRRSDDTTAKVGKLQAQTFSQLAEVAGQRPATPSSSRQTSSGQTSARSPRRHTTGKRKEMQAEAANPTMPVKPHMGLTVRIEMNLPAGGSQETYDRIFKSIREHFLDG